MEYFLYIFIVILAIILIVLFSFKKQIKGYVGEIKVKTLFKNMKDVYLINDVRFKTETKTCQIDHVLVSKAGIFVIETKNYGGRIYGNDFSEQWTQVLNYGKSKYQFFSPVKQNKTHIYELKQKIGNYKFYNCVCFVNGNIEFIKSNETFSLGSLKDFVIYENKNNELYTQDEVLEIVNKITNIKEKIKTSEHVSNINQMQDKINNNICPRCGGILVLRHGKSGSFWGCSNFPKCHFTKKL